MTHRQILIFTCLLSLAGLCPARSNDFYPLAVLRQGNVWILKGQGAWQQLTTTGDARSLCWLDKETICFARERKTGLKDRPLDWQGLEVFRDLFTVKKSGGRISQFTLNHFATEPAPGNIPGRALFTHFELNKNEPADVWESILPVFRDRYLGIRGHLADSSPDQRWVAATLGIGHEGIVLHNYPDGTMYRKIEGPFGRPRFAPEAKQVAFLSHDPEKGGLYLFDMPSGEPRWILPLPAGYHSLEDFGWSSDGHGFILLLTDNTGKRDVFYHEIGSKENHKVTDTGDVERVTGWH